VRVWSMVAGFFRFWYDFIIGDDWRVAAAIVVALILTALLLKVGLPAWWLMPLTVIAMTGLSLRRESRAT